MNNEPVAPKKRKLCENAKDDEQLAKTLEDNEGVAWTARQLSKLNELNAGNAIIKYKLSFFNNYSKHESYD